MQKRLRKIEKNWDRFAAFYFVEGAPATNNLVENYYSTSLKTHRKRQFRADMGIENQMKLSQMKRAGMLEGGGRTLLEVFSRFRPVYGCRVKSFIHSYSQAIAWGKTLVLAVAFDVLTAFRGYGGGFEVRIGREDRQSRRLNVAWENFPC